MRRSSCGARTSIVWDSNPSSGRPGLWWAKGRPSRSTIVTEAWTYLYAFARPEDRRGPLAHPAQGERGGNSRWLWRSSPKRSERETKKRILASTRLRREVAHLPQSAHPRGVTRSSSFHRAPPSLQPAERLWPLSNEGADNRNEFEGADGRSGRRRFSSVACCALRPAGDHPVHTAAATFCVPSLPSPSRLSTAVTSYNSAGRERG